MKRIEILDTTLRDGAQGEGVVFSREDKLKVIRALDELGVDYIEAGNPAASPKDADFFRFVSQKVRLKHARLVAFGATCRAGACADQDAALIQLAGAGADIVSLFGKASLFQVTQVLRTAPEENLRMIRDSVSFLRGRGLTVFFDAEHFFDGCVQDEAYAFAALKTAAEAGAAALVLCDTNGGTLPERIAGLTRRAVQTFDLPVAIHCHNDAGLATAATLAAVQAGATQVQGAINGYGERCGNANLCQVLPNLMLKMGYDCLRPDSLRLLTPMARRIGGIANLDVEAHSPYVGRSAFAHKGGMHIDGMLKDARAFEQLDPALVGNNRRFLVSELAGRGALMTRLSALAPDIDRKSEQAARIMEMLKALESEGYSFEDADASLALRALGALGRRKSFFEVLDFHVVSRKPEDERNAQAYVKARVGESIEITADEGDGPVNALDKAVRKALSRFYPCLSRMHLKDFKVRVVNSQGTASSVRVQMDSTDGERVWGTVGVSTNIIEASFIALTDSIEYMLLCETGEMPGV